MALRTELTAGHATTGRAGRFDLESYLHRLGWSGEPTPEPAILRSLHAAHTRRMPFENLDVRLGRPVGLDLESLQAKLVRRRRGGYCFEQNTLFAAALRAIGFSVQTLEARVRPPGAAAPLPRTHMVLAVEAADRSWLADVGFGGDGPAYPVPLDGEESEQLGGAYAVVREPGDVRVLRRRWEGGWRDLYAFTLLPALPVDFEVAHHFTSTHPRSPFVQTLTVQRTTPELRQVLRGRTYTEQGAQGEVRRELSDSEVVELVTGAFGLDVPEEDVRRALSDS
jgi:N-hydroxyarylamine O-acetyltransferase